MVQSLEPNFFQKKCQEAHQIDQRNVPNTKLYVVVGGWVGNPFCSFFFLQVSEVAKTGGPNFVIIISSRGDRPPPPLLYPSLGWDVTDYC